MVNFIQLKTWQHFSLKALREEGLNVLQKTDNSGYGGIRMGHGFQRATRLELSAPLQGQ